MAYSIAGVSNNLKEHHRTLILLPVLSHSVSTCAVCIRCDEYRWGVSWDGSGLSEKLKCVCVYLCVCLTLTYTASRGSNRSGTTGLSAGASLALLTGRSGGSLSSNGTLHFHQSQTQGQVQIRGQRSNAETETETETEAKPEMFSVAPSIEYAKVGHNLFTITSYFDYLVFSYSFFI